MIRACAVQDVPLGEGRAIRIAGRRVAIFHAASGWYALDAVCPHLGGPLADGILADRAVICPLHERRFDLATGKALTTGEDVAAHRVEVREGAVHVTLAPVACARAAA